MLKTIINIIYIITGIVLPIIILIHIGLLYNNGLIYLFAVSGIVSVSNTYESKQIKMKLYINYINTQ